MEDRIDIHNYRRRLDVLLERVKNSPCPKCQILPQNRDFILNYLRDAELGKTIKKGQKRAIGEARLWRSGTILIQLDKWLKKPFNEATMKDMEDLISELNSGKICTRKGTRYRDESLMTIKKFIRKFWKWLKGDNKIHPPEVDWIDTTGREAEIEAIPNLYEGIKKITDLAPSTLKKAIIMTLFDSGCRESEFLNIRIKDVSAVKDDDTIYLTIRYPKITGAKIEPRTVGAPYATTILREWLEIHPDKDNPEAQLFPVTKQFLVSTVKRLGKKALNRNITVQMFRHTGATFFAPMLDRATFCKRFGWAFSSRMPDRYIDFAKIPQKKAVEIIQSDRFSKIQKENEILKGEIESLKAKYTRHEELLNRLLDISAQDIEHRKKWRALLNQEELNELLTN